MTKTWRSFCLQLLIYCLEIQQFTLTECRAAIAQDAKNDFNLRVDELKDLSLVQLQDVFVVSGGFDKLQIWGSAMPRLVLDCIKRIVSQMYHVLGDRSASLMNFVSDGRYSPQVEGTPTLICWLLLPDPREIGSFPAPLNIATELNGRLIVAKGGDETPECIAAAFSKRREARHSCCSIF
jgi:hypothetical protein